MLKVILPIALAFAMLFFFYTAYQDAKPQSRDTRIYSELKEFIPYKLKKRFTGLTIISTKNDKEEKPPSSQVMHRFDQLEQQWGKSHLLLDGNILTVLDDNNQSVKTITLQNKSEMGYVKNFFGL